MIKNLANTGCPCIFSNSAQISIFLLSEPLKRRYNRQSAGGARAELEMYQRIHGQDQPHADTASSIHNLGDAYKQLRKASENHEQSLEMYRAIHKDMRHLDIAISLWHIGLVYHK